MIRWILLVLLFFGFANGWLVFNNKKFLDDFGITYDEEKKAINWKEFIIDNNN